jgi:acetyl-CoA C-acetyltransferase
MLRRLYSTLASNPLKDVVIVGAARTPVGSFRSTLSAKSAPQLGAIAIQGALKQSGVEADAIGEVLMGNVISAGLGQAPARQAALLAGLPESTICTTVNKVCASGLKAVMLGAQSILLGNHDNIVAGGMESMSNAPFYLNARNGFAYGNQEVLDSILSDGLMCATYKIHMGECAEETAAKYNITREQQDAYALKSYRRAAEAVQTGKFQREIVAVNVETRKGTTIVNEDEEYKRIDIGKVANLKPAFIKTGTITAANASTLNDGASAVVLGRAGASNARPLARILAMADAECNPKSFAIAPSLAIPKALRQAGLTASEIDLWEINEAFGVVALVNMQLLELDPEKVNKFGGAVALGHPIGSSGCRLLVTLVHQLQPGQKGCVAICNGGGGASAMIIERL